MRWGLAIIAMAIVAGAGARADTPGAAPSLLADDPVMAPERCSAIAVPLMVPMIFMIGDRAPKDDAARASLLAAADDAMRPTDAHNAAAALLDDSRPVHTVESTKRACTLAQAAIRGGVIDTYVLLGELLTNAAKADAEKEWAILAFQRAAQVNNPYARMWIEVVRVHEHAATPERRKAAAQALRELAATGFAPAHMYLGNAALEGWEHKPDAEEARGEFETAARGGVAEAAEALGNMYQNGAGSIPVDPARSEQWFARAYAAGRPFAAIDAGVEAESQRRVDHDYRRALAWFQRAADAGFISAKAEMAKTIAFMLTDPHELPRACGLAREAASAGFRSGYGTLGAMQMQGISCARDPKAGMASLEHAIDMGSIDAMNLLARELAIGRSVPRDVARAKLLFEKSANGGLTASACSLGTLIAIEQPGPAGLKAAFKWLAIGAGNGWTECQAFLGDAIARGQVSEVPNRLAGVELLDRAVGGGSTTAQVALGSLYASGTGVARDPERARKLFEAAAAKNDSAGVTALGMCYVTDACGVPRDPAKAVQLLERAVALGNSNARVNLGLMLLHGMRVTADRPRAIGLLIEAAEAGNPNAMRGLYEAYHDPSALDRDGAKAFAWAKRAVEAGNLSALNVLADCYRTGEGTPRDTALAAQTYKRSAEAGNVDGMNAWGLLQLEGSGTPRDIAGGAKYIQMAAERGVPNALMTLASLYNGRMLGERDPVRTLAAITLAIVFNDKFQQSNHVSALDSVRQINAATLRDHLRATLPHDDLVRADTLIAEMAGKIGPQGAR